MRGKLRCKVENDEITRDIYRRDGAARTVMGSESNLRGKLCTFSELILCEIRRALAQLSPWNFQIIAGTVPPRR